jgi:hypothetical protein
MSDKISGKFHPIPWKQKREDLNKNWIPFSFIKLHENL